MPEPEIFIIQCYRQEPGDVGRLEAPTIGETIRQAEKSAGEFLLGYHQDQNRLSKERPHHARLVDKNGRTVLEIRVDGHGGVQRVLGDL